MNRLPIIMMALCGVQLSAHPSAALVIDDRTNVYFAYWGGTWKFGGDGKLTRIAPNDFHFMALDSMGRFANANIPFMRVTAQGSQPSIFSFSDYPGTFHTDGDLYTAPWSIGRIRVERMNSGGGKTVVADSAIDPRIARKPGRHEGGILTIASGANGLLYVSDGASIWTVSSQGAVAPIAEKVVVPNCPKDLPAELPQPHIRSLAIAANGDVYAAAIGCRAVLRINAAGGISVVLRAENPWSPSAVGLAKGDLYVMEYDNPLAEYPSEGRPRIRKLARDGTITVPVLVAKASSSAR